MMNDLIVKNEQLLNNNNVSMKLLDDFYKSIDVEDITIRTYKKGIDNFIKWLKDNEITSLDKKVMLSYKDYLKKNYKPTTATTYLSGVRNLFNFLEELGIPNLMRNIKGIKINLFKIKNMAEIKYFELVEADSFQAYGIMSMIVGRCAGDQKDPDTNESWAKYENVDISIIRSSEPMPVAKDNHNQLQKAIIEEFAPRFAPNSECLYVGDTRIRVLCRQMECADNRMDI